MITCDLTKFWSIPHVFTTAYAVDVHQHRIEKTFGISHSYLSRAISNPRKASKERSRKIKFAALELVDGEDAFEPFVTKPISLKWHYKQFCGCTCRRWCVWKVKKRFFSVLSPEHGFQRSSVALLATHCQYVPQWNKNWDLVLQVTAILKHFVAEVMRMEVSRRIHSNNISSRKHHRLWKLSVNLNTELSCFKCLCLKLVSTC